MASAFRSVCPQEAQARWFLALVLALIAASGIILGALGEMLARTYTGFDDCLSIAAADNDMTSLFSDTGMAECLVIARKRKPWMTTGRLRDRTFHIAEEHAQAAGLCSRQRTMQRLLTSSHCPVRQIEDGPYGGTPLVGDESCLLGEMLITALTMMDGGNWVRSAPARLPP